MFQEYACTGVGWGVRPKRIFEYRGGWGVQKWPFWGVRTLWMAPFEDSGGRRGESKFSPTGRGKPIPLDTMSKPGVQKCYTCMLLILLDSDY